MRRKYIHELKGWPTLHWSTDKLAEPLASVRHCQGRLIGHMEALGFDLQREAALETLTLDVLKSSEIEGEKLDAGQVRSSIAGAWAWTSARSRPPTARSKASSK
jgi:Fic family protein